MSNVLFLYWNNLIKEAQNFIERIMWDTNGLTKPYHEKYSVFEKGFVSNNFDRINLHILHIWYHRVKHIKGD